MNQQLIIALIGLLAMIIFAATLIHVGRNIVSQLMAHIRKIESERDAYRSEAEAYKLEMEQCFSDTNGSRGS